MDGAVSADPDAIYQAASVFATTLQVPRGVGPPEGDSVSQRYWNGELEKLVINERTRNYLETSAKLAFLPAPISKLIGGWNQFLALGFLPDQGRWKLVEDWTAADRRRFEEWLKVFRVLDHITARALMRIAMKAYVWDLRLRYVTGRVIVPKSRWSIHVSFAELKKRLQIRKLCRQRESASQVMGSNRRRWCGSPPKPESILYRRFGSGKTLVRTEAILDEALRVTALVAAVRAERAE